MTDRELVERAAKAAGLELFVWGTKGEENYAIKESGRTPGPRWNPLEDDADSLRLAVNLGFGILFESQTVAGQLHRFVEVSHSQDEDTCRVVTEPLGEDPCATTRRAITRAAAAMAGDTPATNGTGEAA